MKAASAQPFWSERPATCHYAAQRTAAFEIPAQLRPYGLKILQNLAAELFPDGKFKPTQTMPYFEWRSRSENGNVVLMIAKL
ncbi:MAG: hypothetical protein OCD03_11490 [Hyphomicrobiales bacterium]